MDLDDEAIDCSFNEKQLILSQRDLKIVGAKVIEHYGRHCEYLDLGYNRLNCIEKWIYDFPQLKCLILDGNYLREAHLQKLKQPLDRLRVLMLNKNEFSDLKSTTDILSKIFPNLEYLSLHGNPICPDNLNLKPFSDYVPYEYEHYKNTLIAALPKLKFLDHSALAVDESAMSVHASRNGSNSSSSSWLSSGTLWSKFKRFLRSNTSRSHNTIAKLSAKTSYQGLQSEGNRYITNSDL
ncbi:leucine-rich melanocyte differentiation-associated protein [Glossina fuscipes]|uniref:Leucine-rich melanocyte differentiation-associated protein n=1 Tax=Glossina fuscipes TaxID=7396 RepID=A0A8U0WH61_9MUSC|nr:leucine-rich melanocyte differentiation-associated protein [Glossina fuscipes]